ncbi:MAG TPA: CAP domain-containing protein [Thermoanaerobaculia bacterium]|nr:CAP domain-containing protein [Thermoanaerobaculia bacterium]
MRTPVSAIALICSLALSSLSAQPAPEYGESNGSFPSWQERAVAQLTNRARVEPSTELAACPAGQCLEAACYSPVAPLYWNYDLNQAARFHSLTMGKFPFFAHNTPCVLFSDIDTRFPGSSDGSFASSCSTSGTTTAGSRVNLFGATYKGENAAAGQSTPHGAFYGWLYETTSTSTCGFNQQNGHRYNILKNTGPAAGVGYAQVSGSPYGSYWTQDFGGSAVNSKVPSGSHWTAMNHVRDPSTSDNSIEFWANWYDVAGGAPATATVVLDNIPAAMTRIRGTATNGAYRAIVSGVPNTCHTYYFSFVDSSLNTVRYPTTGSLGFGAGCPDFQDGGGTTAPAAPAGVSAIATSSTQVQVTWNAVTGATSYEIYRRNPGGAFTLRGTSLTTSYTDSASSHTAYLYRVRAVNAGGSSGDSASALATTVMFTNDPLAGGVAVRAVHLGELRTAVNAVRAQAGLSAGTYTDAAATGVVIKAVHITQLRSSLDAAMSALALTTGGWTDASLSSVRIKATHVQEIRNRVK